MKKLSWKKVGCLLLALLMAATMLATGVVATYDNVYNSDNLPETGSITITKLDRDEQQLSRSRIEKRWHRGREYYFCR